MSVRVSIDRRKMTIDEAKRIVARQVIFDAARLVDWEEYPDIGEEDWSDVVQFVSEFSDAPMVDDYTEAYVLLSARANQEDQ